VISQDLTLQAILSNGVATVRQTLGRMFSAMAAEKAKKWRKLVLTPVFAIVQSCATSSFSVESWSGEVTMRMNKLAALVAGTTLLCLLLISATGLKGSNTSPASGKVAPDFTLQDSEGASVNLSAYKGRVVLLDFWATWCHGCQTEIPWYVEFQNRYKSRGLAAIGVSMDDDGWKSVKPFLQQNKLNYPVVIGNQALAKVYGVDALPVTLLIDRQGKIVRTHAGMVDKSSFEHEIQALLREK